MPGDEHAAAVHWRDRLPAGFTTRFAPSPTGLLHLGHVVNAVWVWGLAQACGGRVLLRIEDHDRGRCRPDFERAILEDLDWLGLAPHGTPQLRQSDDLARYAARLAALERAGLAYACDCSRRTIAAAQAELGEGQEPRYPGTCRARGVDPNATPARRVRMDAAPAEVFDDLRLGGCSQDPASQCGDLLVRDRTGDFTYQFAVVVDDLEQGIDVVIRGEDLLDSTGRQIRLARLLGRAAPPRFLHHPLVLGADGRKLSKSAGSEGLRELRAAGHSPEQVLGLAAAASGLAPAGASVSADALGGLFGG